MFFSSLATSVLLKIAKFDILSENFGKKWYISYSVKFPVKRKTETNFKRMKKIGKQLYLTCLNGFYLKYN